jgi:hypothetical protein
LNDPCHSVRSDRAPPSGSSGGGFRSGCDDEAGFDPGGEAVLIDQHSPAFAAETRNARSRTISWRELASRVVMRLGAVD